MIVIAVGIWARLGKFVVQIDKLWSVFKTAGVPTVIHQDLDLDVAQGELLSIVGGSGGGIAYNREEFLTICERGLDASPTSELLIEESLLGWKEFEMEVVRDKKDNCIIVCSIENLDPMGVHTGDSVTVAPQQTLSDDKYQELRDQAIAIIRAIEPLERVVWSLTAERLDEVNLDFQVLGPASTGADEEEVLIAASRKEKVEDRVAAAESAGLKAL